MSMCGNMPQRIGANAMDELFEGLWNAVTMFLCTIAICFAIIGIMHGNIIGIGLGIGIVMGGLKSRYSNDL